MKDEHGRAKAYEISWAEPDLRGATPAWTGPSPDARHEPEPESPAAAPRPRGMSEAWSQWAVSEPAATPVPTPTPAAPAVEHDEVAHDEIPTPVESSEPAEHHAVEHEEFGHEVAAHDPVPAQPVASEPVTAEHEPVPAEVTPEHEEVVPESAHEHEEFASAPEQPRSGSTPVPHLPVEPEAAHDADHDAPDAAVDSPQGVPVPAHESTEPEDVEPEAAPHEVAAEPQAYAVPEPGQGYDQSFMAVQDEHHESMASHGTPRPGEFEQGHDAQDAPYVSRSPQVVGQNDDIPEDALTIGRSRSNVIVLDDMLVSRQHVVITADEEGLLLRDLGSRNGTYVNGQRVEHSHLDEGDRIGIGASTFEVRDGWLVSV